MAKFEHIRHQPPLILEEDRPLIIACSPLSSHVNLSTILRMAGCSGIQEVIASGNAKIKNSIARDSVDTVKLTVKNSLSPILKKLKKEGYILVGLEQTTNSTILSEYTFSKKSVIVVGSEREGLSQENLDLLDAVVEIPVWGMPYSYNVATATSLAIYEYCRQYPTG